MSNNSNYVLNTDTGKLNIAGPKAKKDITSFLTKKGFRRFDLEVPKNKLQRLNFVLFKIKKLIRKKNINYFIIQYPLYSKIISNAIIKSLNPKTKKILIVHDLESIRLENKNSQGKKWELSFFNHFNYLIVHNEAMREWLKKQGIKIPMVNLEIFDYLNLQKINTKNKLTKSICYAGNLKKSVFLKKANLKTKIDIFGPGSSQNYPKNVHYRGQYSPEDLPKYLKQDFGLVWDGISTDTCSGLYGKYLRYNDPHKVSLYLSSGLPILIWKKAALCRFIENNHLGIGIKKISDIDKIYKDISLDQYQDMTKNVYKVAKKIRNGFFIYKAIKKIFSLEKNSLVSTNQSKVEN